jgi:signal peptidase I
MPASKPDIFDTKPSGLGTFLAMQRAGSSDSASSSEDNATPNSTPANHLPPSLSSDIEHEEIASSGDESADGGGSSGWKTAWAIVREVGETVLLTLIIFLLIQMVVRNFRVVGTSMVNNLHDGQYLIIDKLSYNPWLNEYLGFGGLQRGDVVVFEPPRHPDEDYVKRIIALPGEKVQVLNGQVIINGDLLDEPFEPNSGTYSMAEPVIVPEGQVFVLGDNRNNSNDSHNWGPLPVENIVGRAWVSYWPPELWGTIPRDAPTEEATLKYVIQQVIPSANASNQ